MQPLQTDTRSLSPRPGCVVCMTTYGKSWAGLGAKSCQPSVVVPATASHQSPSPFDGPLLLDFEHVLWPPCSWFQAGLLTSLAWPTKHSAMEPPSTALSSYRCRPMAVQRGEGLQMTLPPKQSFWQCV
ncbi:hypothetical protein LZ31DRAFT_204975 [Colletotrichum somersetense]|nr:hypothetical protein LZ31DRAFT_204975 [Colletotrichum somersetense]